MLEYIEVIAQKAVQLATLFRMQYHWAHHNLSVVHEHANQKGAGGHGPADHLGEHGTVAGRRSP